MALSSPENILALRIPCLPVEFANADERQRYFQDYFQKLPEDDLKTFRSDSTVIGDLSFQAKLASVMGRSQIRRGRPCKNKNGQ